MSSDPFSHSLLSKLMPSVDSSDSSKDHPSSLQLSLSPSETENVGHQFEMVTKWLSQLGLTKTLDTLVDEFDIRLLSNQKEINKIIPKAPLSKNLLNISTHKSSVLTVRFHPSKPWIVSSDTTKLLIIHSFRDGSLLTNDRDNNPFGGSIISVDWNPVYHDLLLIGTMDFKHALLQVTEDDGKIKVKTLQKFDLHTKYVIRTKWAPCGTIFATGSHDGSVAFYQLEEDKKSAKFWKQINFTGYTEAIEFTQDSKYLICSIRGESQLHYVQVNSWEISLASVNQLGDSHVSFTILDLKRSLDGKQLLAATDASCGILFKTGTPIQINNFYGLDNDSFSQPRGLFDKEGLAYITSQDNLVYVFDNKTAQIITKIKGHNSLVRDLDVNFNEDLLATCSYDKTIKIWAREEETI